MSSYPRIFQMFLNWMHRSTRLTKFEFTYVPSDDPSQADAYRPGARVETCEVHLAKYINFGFGDRELFLNRLLLIVCKLTLG